MNTKKIAMHELPYRDDLGLQCRAMSAIIGKQGQGYYVVGQCDLSCAGQ